MKNNKTLEEILECTNYETLSKSLLEKVQMIANKIAIKLSRLDEVNKRISVNYKNADDNYVYVTVMAKAIDAKIHLTFETEGRNKDGYLDTLYKTLCDFESDNAASVNEAIRFLGAAKGIIEKINEIETHKVDEINKTLEDTEEVLKDFS